LTALKAAIPYLAALPLLAAALAAALLAAILETAAQAVQAVVAAGA
jgi:hypothetical protein